MAGLGFKDFAVGEVLTSADVDGYLMQQSVMRFASSAARGSALGTATGTAVPLAEGMVSYLDDVNSVQMFTGTEWVGINNFSASTAITATNASWPVPTLGNPIVRVTVVGGGGGGGATIGGGNAGGSSSFATSAGTATAAGGAGGQAANATVNGLTGVAGMAASNHGNAGVAYNAGAQLNINATNGLGGEIKVAYLNLTGISTANVTVGAGGAATTGSTSNGGAGGRGEVIVEYVAG